MTRIIIAPRSHDAESLRDYSAVTVMLNPGRLVTVNNPSIAHFPTKGGITVRSRTDATVRSTHSQAHIVAYYNKGGDHITVPDTEEGRRVARGVRLMDERHPGWANDVDLSKFNLRHVNMCVLGQTIGGYWPALNRLGLSDAQAKGYGFNANNEPEYLRLEAEWVRVIAARQTV